MNATDQPIDLTIIIPVFNAASYLGNLHDSIGSIDSDFRVQTIYVDDGSTDGSADLLRELVGQSSNTLALFQPNVGAGQARNRGWVHATGRYTLFFDADDRLHSEAIPPAIARMEADPEIDLAVLAYRFERQDIAHSSGMLPKDAEAFDQLLGSAKEACDSLEKFARLLTITNYPWNKIQRTARYREMGMRFGHTKVNNDILGHWYALLHARQILLSRDELCTHVIHPGGSNLTNQQGAVRLQMFDALNELYDMLQANPDLRQRYAHFFWGFVLTLFKWAREKITPETRSQYNRRMADLITRIDLIDFAKMRNSRAPTIASELSSILTSR